MSSPEVICYGERACPRRLKAAPGTYRCCDADGEPTTGIVEEWVARVGDKHYWWACPVEEACLDWIVEQSPEWFGYSCQGCPVWTKGLELEALVSDSEPAGPDCAVLRAGDEAL